MVLAMFRVIDRLSELPCVERVWTAHSERADDFLSIAATNCELVVSRYRDQTFLTVRGPETRMTTIDCPAEGEWVGIRFKQGNVSAAVSSHVPERPERRDAARRIDAIVLAQRLGVGESIVRKRRYFRGTTAQESHLRSRSARRGDRAGQVER